MERLEKMHESPSAGAGSVGQARGEYLQCMEDYRALARHVRTLTDPHERLDGGEQLVAIARRAQEAFARWVEAKRDARASS